MSPKILPLATLTPSSSSRTWLSSPHPDLPLIATACADHTAKIYSLKNFRLTASASGGHKRSVRSVAWKPSFGVSSSSSSGSSELTLATGSFDASTALWKRGGREKNFGEDGGGGGAGGASGFGDEEPSNGGNNGEEEEEEWNLEVILDGHDSEVKSLGFCATAPLLATCSRDKSIWIWEELEDEDGGGGEMNFETVAVLSEHEGDVKCVCWHPTEQMVASGSYDDEIRLWKEDVDDWACCARLDRHKGTVWWVEFEGEEILGEGLIGEENGGAKKEWRDRREKAGPRLISCSDDLSIRVWRRVPKNLPAAPTGQGRVPSIWKNNNFEEEWVEEAVLPQTHDRPIYAVNWSRKTGRVVSAGSDGLIVVYEERWRGKTGGEEVEMKDGEAASEPDIATTEWVVVAQTENAHDVFEINHVVWAPRADKGKTRDGEEVIVSTGDDGEVKVWTLED